MDASRIGDVPRAESRIDDLVDRAARRGRRSIRARIARLHSKMWQIGQASLAAGLAWLTARTLLDHPAPVFAPIVAVVCLGVSYRQRLRRVAEVTVGVAIGLFVADAFVAVAGHGAWQITVVAATAMAIAVFLDASDALVMQSVVQSIFVVALVAVTAPPLTRFLDALVGGAVALLAATVVPSAPLRRPRVQASAVARTTAQLLRACAAAARTADVDAAVEVLARARTTDVLVRELQAAADEGMDVIASSPFARTHTPHVRRVADLIDPLARALLGTRVLARRVVVATSAGDPVPDSYLQVVEHLADAVEALSHILADNSSPENARSPLTAVARATGDLERTGRLSTDVVLAQIRTITVDLLQVAGLSVDQAVATLPRLRTGDR